MPEKTRRKAAPRLLNQPWPFRLSAEGGVSRVNVLDAKRGESYKPPTPSRRHLQKISKFLKKSA